MSKLSFSASDAAATFNQVVVDNGLKPCATPDDFRFGKDYVVIGRSPGGEKLATRLLDQFFPQSPGGIYHHYTSYGGFRGIISSGKLRLYNLHKRFGSGEFRTFCRDHGLDGYLRQNSTGEEEGHFSDLMGDLFYTSLVNETASASHVHWDKFANHHQGVRLTFEIYLAPGYQNFRAVTYQEPDCIPLLKELQAAFLAKGLRFVSLGLSRMGGFYQRKEFSSQFEHRLLAKRFPGPANEFPFVVHEDNKLIKFIESDLTRQDHGWFNIKLIGVTVGRSGSFVNAQNYLRNSRFSGITPLAAPGSGNSINGSV